MTATTQPTASEACPYENVPFTVQDRRRKGFFTLDNELYDLYARKLGPYGLAVYVGLARFANQASECFPSQSTLAQRARMSRMQVSREIEKLKRLHLIAVDPQFGPQGQKRSNLYILLDLPHPDLPHVTESDIPCNTQLQPHVTESDILCNTQLHKQNIENNTYVIEQNTDNNARPDNNNNSDETGVLPPVVVALIVQGIAEKVAQRLAQHYSQSRIEEKIEYLAFLLEERQDEVKKPAAWLRKAIEDNYSAPDGYLSAAERTQRRQQAEQEQERHTELAKLAQAAQEARQAAEAAEQEAREQRMRDEYGTTEEDSAFWEQAQREIKLTTSPDIFESIADAQILKLTEETVLIGVESEAQWRQLQHPGTVCALKRTLGQVAGRPVKLEVVRTDIL